MVIAALCIGLVVGSFVNVAPAFAVVFTSINARPGQISADTTPTFGFSGFDMGGPTPTFECKIDGDAFAPCTSPYTSSALAAGEHTFTVHAIGESNTTGTASHTWTINLAPTFSGGTSVNGVAGVPIAVTDLQIDDQDNDALGVKLAVPSGTLKLGTTTGISLSGSPTGSTIMFSGTRANLNSALATLIYTPASAGIVDIDATLTGASGGDKETFNGHFYRIVDLSVDWSAAKVAAEASTYGGVSGYLATVTSAAEEAYLEDRMSDGAWIGATDSVSEGDWRWVGGPEVGTSFWNGGAIGGAYTNWQALQPDNYNGNENCLELRLNSSEAWNDENCSSLRQYIIEYGTDDELPSLDTAQVSATVISASGDADSDGVSNAAEANAPNNGDANDDGMADYTQANVSSQYSSLSDGYVVIQTTCTTNQQVQLSAESQSQSDVAYDYPYGLASFTGTTCGAPGSTTTVTQYYYGTTDPGTLILRKWNAATGVYSTIDTANLSAVTIDGSLAVKVAYEVVDGGALDQDGVADGNITDPVGLAALLMKAPDAGDERRTTAQPLFYGLLIVAVLAGIYMIRRRSH